MPNSFDLTGKKISETYKNVMQCIGGKIYDGLGNELTYLEIKKYTHIQSTPSSTWVVIHNLGFKPQISIFDSSNSVVIGDIIHDNINQATLTFSAPFAGEALCS